MSANAITVMVIVGSNGKRRRKDDLDFFISRESRSFLQSVQCMYPDSKSSTVGWSMENNLYA